MTESILTGPLEKKIAILISALFLLLAGCGHETGPLPRSYNPVRHQPSRDASGSIPCGGGDIGLNVWVENGDILFYMARSGTFDENNTLLKLGRIRLDCDPNPFIGGEFRQELLLDRGYVQINGESEGVRAQCRIWVDVHRPVIHVGINSNRKILMILNYENWRYRDLPLKRDECRENSYKWVLPPGLVKKHDSISFSGDGILFFHRNDSNTVFDVSVAQQGMEQVKEEMYDPLGSLTFGGLIRGTSFRPSGTGTGKYQDTEFRAWRLESGPSRKHEFEIVLHTGCYKEESEWSGGLSAAILDADRNAGNAFRETETWWNEFWKRSFILIRTGQDGMKPSDSSADRLWQAGRNYQLFRYMLGCNAYGDWPTRFNGGLFTFDPSLTVPEWKFSPDFRNWTGGTFTAQNQRLVYYPMLKSGDFDLMKPQLDFYRRNLHNAELRSQVYWGHGGACFTEQIENFGLPNCSEYGWERPAGMDPGMQHNDWLEYQWDTALEFCRMILQIHEYTGQDISGYIPLIESCLGFFDEHYRLLALQRGEPELDSAGRLVLYPGSACETYKAAMNATPTIAALKKVTEALVSLPQEYLEPENRLRWSRFLERVPDIEYRDIGGHTIISPARSWERIRNTEIPQLYPVFPWRIFGIGKAGLDTALNTWRYDPDVLRFRDHQSWKQYNIMAACLGLRDEAEEEMLKKLQDGELSFPAFWGPGMDWVPDHNWGGSGMIGLQEMLLQTDGKKIFLFPAWPSETDVHFRLHAPGNTIVEARIRNGIPELLRVEPESRIQDIVMIPECNR